MVPSVDAMVTDWSRGAGGTFTSAAMAAGSRPKLSSGNPMASEKGPNIKKKQKCKNCEGKGLLKKGEKVVKCQRCGGTGLR
jgi:hypothetical protein